MTEPGDGDTCTGPDRLRRPRVPASPGPGAGLPAGRDTVLAALAGKLERTGISWGGRLPPSRIG